MFTKRRFLKLFGMGAASAAVAPAVVAAEPASTWPWTVRTVPITVTETLVQSHPTLAELFDQTMRDQAAQVAENMLRHNALFARLAKDGE